MTNPTFGDKKVTAAESPGMYMGVSKNRGGPPKSSILIGFSIIFTIYFPGRVFFPTFFQTNFFLPFYRGTNGFRSRGGEVEPWKEIFRGKNGFLRGATFYCAEWQQQRCDLY